MSDDLHDKILSCDDLATKNLPQLEKMRTFYKIKTEDINKHDTFFKYRQWSLEHKKLHTAFLITSILSFIISFYLTITKSPYFIILSIISVLYILISGVLNNDVRSQAVVKNIATINYMIQTFADNKASKTNNIFRKKAQTVYECIRQANNGRINFSDLLKAVRKIERSMDKNTLKKILEQDLVEVLIINKAPYGTNSRDLSNTTIYSIKI